MAVAFPEPVCTTCGYTLLPVTLERCPECGFELSGWAVALPERAGTPWVWPSVSSRRAFLWTLRHNAWIALGPPSVELLGAFPDNVSLFAGAYPGAVWIVGVLRAISRGRELAPPWRRRDRALGSVLLVALSTGVAIGVLYVSATLSDWVFTP